MRISTNDKNTLDRNPGDGTMNGKSVTAFLLSPHCRIYRHILLQVAVLLITINVFWYEPLQVVSLLKRFGGCLVYFLSMNAVIYTNLYVLVPSFLLKNRLGGYVLAAIVTNLVVILFLSVTQGMLFEVILPVRNPDGFATFINTFSGILTMGFVTAGSAAISLFTHWLRHNLRIDQLESTTLQSELKFLKSQINPHFLFNTLNTLKWIATLNHVTPVSHGIDALSSLLQSTLIKKDELIPFDDELRNLKNYCDIQQLRYAGRFEMEYQIEDAAGYWTVPRFILQPLVENSILHGTADEDDFVTITVRATVSENLLTIHISDTGCGFDPSAIKEKNSERFSGIGLSNVDERMRLHYGNEYGLTIESAPGTGTQCILRIPNEAIR